MLSKEEIKHNIEEIVNQEGFDLYDIEYPVSTSGVLRVYLFSKNKKIAINDCAMVSRRIANLPEYEDILSFGTSLEVSSPGINRKLRTKEHFYGAIGENVKIRLQDLLEDRKNISGVLKNVDGGIVEVFNDVLQKQYIIQFDNIKDARIDFDFNSIERK